MNPFLPNSVLEQVAKAYAPIDLARAVYRGLVVVGHRWSATAGEMFWALPGGAYLPAAALKANDPFFRVITEPSPVALSLVYQTLHALGEPSV